MDATWESIPPPLLFALRPTRPFTSTHSGHRPTLPTRCCTSSNGPGHVGRPPSLSRAVTARLRVVHFSRAIHRPLTGVAVEPTGGARFRAGDASAGGRPGDAAPVTAPLRRIPQRRGHHGRNRFRQDAVVPLTDAGARESASRRRARSHPGAHAGAWRAGGARGPPPAGQRAAHILVVGATAQNATWCAAHHPGGHRRASARAGHRRHPATAFGGRSGDRRGGRQSALAGQPPTAARSAHRALHLPHRRAAAHRIRLGHRAATSALCIVRRATEMAAADRPPGHHRHARSLERAVAGGGHGARRGRMGHRGRIPRQQPPARHHPLVRAVSRAQQEAQSAGVSHPGGVAPPTRPADDGFLSPLASPGHHRGLFTSMAGGRTRASHHLARGSGQARPPHCHRGLPHGRAAGAADHRYGRARAGHPGDHPRDQLRPAARCGHLSPSRRPHRSHRPRRHHPELGGAGRAVCGGPLRQPAGHRLSTHGGGVRTRERHGEVSTLGTKRCVDERCR
eukprot:ctg_285.g184